MVYFYSCIMYYMYTIMYYHVHVHVFGTTPNNRLYNNNEYIYMYIHKQTPLLKNVTQIRFSVCANLALR